MIPIFLALLVGMPGGVQVHARDVGAQSLTFSTFILLEEAAGDIQFHNARLAPRKQSFSLSGPVIADQVVLWSCMIPNIYGLAFDLHISQPRGRDFNLLCS